MRWRVGAALVWLVACRPALSPRVTRSAPQALTTLAYDARFSADLHSVEVAITLPAGAALRFRLGRDEAAARLLSAALRDSGEALAIEGGRVTVPAASTPRAIVYRADLHDGGDLATLVRHGERSLVTSANAWIMRPEVRSPELRATLAIRAPAGVAVFTPYEQAGDGRYTLDAQAFRYDGYLAFGRGERVAFEHGDVSIDAVSFDDALTQAELRDWITHHLEALAPLSYALDDRTLGVMVVPSRPRGEVFGCVARGGRNTVLAMVPRHAAPASLREDWVLTHELSHFALPFVRREDAWVGEGFATYFQGVLRSRAGQRRARAVLDQLHDTFTRVEREGAGVGTLADESLHMHETGHYRTVYWGGAAIYLALDVAIREHTRGALGLVELVARFREHADTQITWTGDALFGALDRELGAGVLSPIVQRELARPFPDFRATFAALGVTQTGHVLSVDTAHAALRAAIFGAD